MKTQIRLWLYAVLFLPFALFAQGEVVLEFLSLDPTTRANGMAGAFTGVANDASAMHYNPAGLTRITKFGAEVFNDAGWAPNPGRGQISFRYFSATVAAGQRFALGIDYRIADYAEYYFGNFADSSPPINDWALGLGAAANINKNIAVGFTVRFLRSKNILAGTSSLMEVSAAGVGFDFGVIFQNFADGLSYVRKRRGSSVPEWLVHRPPQGPSIGLTIQHMGPGIKYFEEGVSDPIPQTFRLGVGWNLVDTSLLGLVAAIDIQKRLVKRVGNDTDSFYKALFSAWSDPFLSNVIVQMGTEIFVSHIAAVRVGRFIERERYGNRKYNTVGVALGPETLRLNMAFIFPDEEDHPLDGMKFFGISMAY